MGESDALVWVMVASAVIWLGLGAYMTFLAVTQNSLKKRMQQLEQLYNDPQS